MYAVDGVGHAPVDLGAEWLRQVVVVSHLQRLVAHLPRPTTQTGTGNDVLHPTEVLLTVMRGFSLIVKNLM